MDLRLQQASRRDRTRSWSELRDRLVGARSRARRRWERLGGKGYKLESCQRGDSNRGLGECLSQEMSWITVEKYTASRLQWANKRQLFHTTGTQEGGAGSRSQRDGEDTCWGVRGGGCLEQVEEIWLKKWALKFGVEYCGRQKLEETNDPSARRVKSSAWFD